MSTRENPGWSGVAYNFGRVCLSVCMYVCMYACLSICLSDDNFRKPQRQKFIFARPVYFQGIRVRCIYEGHRVKVKVTGAKKS